MDPPKREAVYLGMLENGANDKGRSPPTFGSAWHTPSKPPGCQPSGRREMTCFACNPRRRHRFPRLGSIWPTHLLIGPAEGRHLPVQVASPMNLCQPVKLWGGEDGVGMGKMAPFGTGSIQRVPLSAGQTTANGNTEY